LPTFVAIDSSVTQPIAIQTQCPGNPELLVYRYHLLGMGIDSTIITNSNTLSILLPKLGIYKLTVSVTDMLGNPYASDSAYYSLTMRPVTPTMLAASKSVGFKLFIESGGKTYNALAGNNPITAMLPCKRDSLFKTSWQPGGFQITLDYGASTSGSNVTWSHDSIYGTFSSDLSTIQSLSISNHDTTSWTYAYKYWELIVNGATLAYVTDTLIVYQIINASSDSFVKKARAYNSSGGGYIDLFDQADELAVPMNSLRRGNKAALFVVFRR
jgi:hypothetical protein